MRDRKAGPFYVCETEGCGLDVAASDLDLFEPTTRIPEGALEAAIVEARTPAPVKGAKKRAPKPRAEKASAATGAAAKSAKAVKPAKAARTARKKRPRRRRSRTLLDLDLAPHHEDGASFDADAGRAAVLDEDRHVELRRAAHLDALVDREATAPAAIPPGTAPWSAR